jgi:CHAD domain-containing protein
MNLSTSRPTRALLERRTRALRRHLPAAIAGNGVGVHQARVASRRLREAVPVLAKDIASRKGKKAQRALGKLTRALGVVRELDVTLAVLDGLAREARVPAAAVDEVRLHVVAERERRRVRMLERLERIDTGRLERRLAAIGVALQDASSEHWRGALASRIAKRAKALGAAMAAAGQLYEADTLHRVRIAVKKLRYALEIAAGTGTSAAAPLLGTLERAQDALGRLHDLQVLEAHVAAVRERAGGHRKTHDGLEAFARVLTAECRRLHAQYVALQAALGAAVQEARRVAAAGMIGRARTRANLKMAMTPPGRAASAAAHRRVRTKGRH